jgi:uncharacterized membrane protein
MSTSRLEAFSDGVIAIIITIMVLELHPPESSSLQDLLNLTPKFLAYLFSFLVIAIYWNNHHHLMKAAPKISAGVMWANMHLLFWLSLIPFTTAWLGEHGNYLKQGPVVLYSGLALVSGLAYFLLSRSIVKTNPNTDLAHKIGKDKKGIVSLIIYILAVLLSFFSPALSLVLVFSTAIVWFIPDKRLEALL